MFSSLDDFQSVFFMLSTNLDEGGPLFVDLRFGFAYLLLDARQLAADASVLLLLLLERVLGLLLALLHLRSLVPTFHSSIAQ